MQKRIRESNADGILVRRGAAAHPMTRLARYLGVRPMFATLI